MDKLEPFIGKRVKVRCGRCRRVFEVVAADPWGYRQSVGEPLQVEPVLDGTPNGRGTYSRPSLSTRNANQVDENGRRVDWDEPLRFTYTCHRRCGARYTLTADHLEERYLAAVTASATELLL